MAKTRKHQPDKLLRKDESRQAALLRRAGAIGRFGGWALAVPSCELTWTEEVYRLYELKPTHRPSLADAIAGFAPEARPLFEAGISEAAENGTPFDLELAFRTAKGQRLWIRAQGEPEWEEGKIVRIVGNLQDVTDRRTAEPALKESEARLRSLAEAATEGIFFHENGIIFDANAELCRMVGCELKELLGMDCLELAAPELRAELRAKLASGKNLRYETISQRKDGSRFPIEISARNTVHRGRPVRVVCVRDLTQLHEAEAQLRQNEARLQRVIEGSHQGYWDWNVVTGEVTFSDRWFTMLGYEPFELEQKYETLEKLLHPEDKFAAVAAVRAHIEGRAEQYEMELRMRTKSGEWRWILTRGHVVRRDAAGQAVYLSGTATDITAIKSVESEVRRQAEFLDALHQITLDLLDQRDLHDLMQEIVNRATALLEAPVGEMLLKENDEMVVVAVTANQSLTKGSRLSRPEAPLSWAAHDQSRPVVLANYSAHPDRRQIYDALALQAVAEFPILHRETCLGVLSLGRAEPGRPFTAEEIQRGEILAKNAALVIHHAGIYAAAVREAEQRTVQLRESEAQYRGLITTMNDGVYMADSQGVLTFANPALVRLLGCVQSDQVVGRKIFEFVAPEELTRITGRFQRAVASGQAQPATIVEVVRTDGTRAVTEIKSSVIKEGDHVVAVKGVLRDITQQHRAEQALTLAHRQTKVLAQLGRELAEAATPRMAALSILQAARQLLDWDCSWLQLWDERKQSFEGVTVFDLVDGERREVPLNPDIPPEPSPMVRRVMAEGPQLVLRQNETDQTNGLHLISGTRRSLSLMFAPVRLGDRLVGVLSIQSYQRQAYDTAALRLLQTLADHCAGALARLQATAAQTASEERFRLVWEHATDGMRLADAEGRMVATNDAFCRMYGKTREEIEGQLISTLYAEPEGSKILERHVERFARRDMLTQLERQLTLADGRVVWLEVSNCFIETDPDRPLLLSILRDITDLRRAQQQTLRAQRLESIGTLAGGVAHDLNNALAPIVVATEMLHERYPGSAELIDTMSSSAHRAADMVKQLLTFARGVEGARLLIQPLHLLKEMEKIIKSTFPKSIRLEKNYARQLRTVLGDATQLQQVLLNLCVNARDAMPDGGTLTLAAENVELDAAAASAIHDAHPGKYVVWRVTDTGPGIPPGILERIFEPFFTTKGPSKGTGLGLSTATGIVKSHGGFLRVSSPPDQGAIFEVYLPASDGGTTANSSGQTAG